jgi:hypothetical protein
MSCGALREVGAPQARLLLEGSNNKHDARYNNRAASECVATDGAVDRRRIVMGGLAKNARRKAEGKTAVTSPMPLEAIRRFDALFDIERVILDRILRVDRTLSIEGGLRRPLWR